MLLHCEMADELVRKKIRQKIICFGGNLRLKIFGQLHCRAGKRMKKQQRVFFTSSDEAIQQGFRPCGQCLKDAYKKWKNGTV